MNICEHFIKLPFIQKILQEKKNGKLSNGYLFYSLDAQTNSFAINALATGLICKNNGCFICEDCVKMKNISHPDVLFYPKEKSFSVFDAKDIIEQAYKKPILSDIKIIVINDIDNSSIEAQNKLLKIIEEPPQDVIFLISSANFDKVLPTIKSRLIKIEICSFNKEEIKEILEKYKNNKNFDLAIIKGDGYIGKTLKILNNNDYNGTFEFCKNIVFNLKKSSDVINFLSYKLDKDKFNEILEILSSMYRDLLVYNFGKENLLNDISLIKDYIAVKNEFSKTALVEILNLLNEANERQYFNVSVNLLFETLLINILEVKYTCR